MKVIRPPFREGREWRTLTPQERAGKKWKYVLLHPVFIEVETGLRDHYDCICDGRIWGKILPHGIVISKGYTWNGNSCSPDEIFGTCLRLPSLPHDLLFQFSGAWGFPRVVIDLPWTNWLYLHTAHPFWGPVYYAGLTGGSWAFWGRQPNNGEYVECKPLFQAEPT